MIPLHDNIPSRTTPVVNIVLIALTALAFGAQLLAPEDGPSLIERFGMIPARVMNPDEPVLLSDFEVLGVNDAGQEVGRRVDRPAAPAGVPVWLTLLTCVFLHGGWMHFIGNMWFLWIFGDNVEDCFGKFGFLLFYVIGGIVASATHLFTNLDSPIPTIGASGAVAAVMGAYFVLYPKAKVMTLIPIVFIMQMVVLPASWFLGIWFAIQLYQGTFSLGDVQSAGVAFWAHIGGFVVGYLAAKFLVKKDKSKPRIEVLYPKTERSGSYSIQPRRWRS